MLKGFSEGYIINSIKANLIFVSFLLLYTLTLRGIVFKKVTRNYKQSQSDNIDGIVRRNSLHSFVFVFFSFFFSEIKPIPREESRKFLVTILFFPFSFFCFLLYTLISRGIVQKSDRNNKVVWFPRLSCCKISRHYFVFCL